MQARKKPKQAKCTCYDIMIFSKPPEAPANHRRSNISEGISPVILFLCGLFSMIPLAIFMAVQIPSLALAKIEGNPNLAELIELSRRTSDRDIRAEALGRIRETGPKDKKEFRALLKAATDPSNRELVDSAKIALAIIVPEGEDLRREYRDLLGHRQWEMQALGCIYLGKVKDRGAMRKLRRLLHREDLVGGYASKALGQIGDPDAIEAMIKYAAASHGESLAGIGAFGAIGAQALVKAAEDIDEKGESSVPEWLTKKPEKLESILRALKLRVSADAIEYLKTQKYHPRSDMRAAVIQSLGRLGDTSAINELKEALYNPDYGICRAAMSSLAWIQTRESLKAIEEAMLDERIPSGIRALYASALAYYGWTESIPALQAAASGGKSENVRVAAKHAIKNINRGYNEGSRHNPTRKRLLEERERMKYAE